MADLRLDSGMFLARQLEQRLPEVYEKRYPQLWAVNGDILPNVGDLELGADSVVAEFLDQAGEAEVYADGSTDIPMVDISVSEDTYKTFMFVSKANWTIPQLAKAEKAGKDLGSLKFQALRRAIDERAHKFACFGSAKHGAKGLFNLTGVTVDDNSFDADNASTDADDYIQFFGDIITNISNSTNMVEMVDTIVAPEKLIDIGRRLRLGGSERSALSYILENYGAAAGGSLRRIVAKNECQSSFLEEFGVHSGGTDKDRIILLPTNPDALQRKFFPLDFLDPQQRDMTWSVVGYSAASEVLCHYPGSINYVDIPKL